MAVQLTKQLESPLAPSKTQANKRRRRAFGIKPNNMGPKTTTVLVIVAIIVAVSALAGSIGIGVNLGAFKAEGRIGK